MKTTLQFVLNTVAASAFSLLGGNMSAQTSPAWVKFAGPSNYQNYDVREVSAGVDTVGNTYTGASFYDTISNKQSILVTKYNTAGSQLWMKYYNSSATFADSYLVKLLVDKAGNSYACGYGHHGGSTSKDFMVVKFDNAGNQQWVNYWDAGQSSWDYITCASFDAAGNIIVAGYGNDNGGSNGDDMAVVKYSPSGTQLWSYVYNYPAVNGEDRVLSVTSDAAGNILLAGSSEGSSNLDMIAMKLNSAGVNQWITRFPHVNSSNDEKAYSITADPAGNAYITGDQNDWVTVKLSAAGSVLWTTHYTAGSLNSGNLKKVILGKANTLIVAGDAFFGGGYFTDMVAFVLDRSTGVQTWATNINLMGSDVFSDAVADTSVNTVFMTARIDGPSGNDMGTVAVSSAGLMSWSSIYSNPSNSSGRDVAFEMVMDKTKNLILAGVSATRGSGSADEVDVITLKYSALVTGISKSQLEIKELTMYPNPASERLTIRHNTTELIGAEIRINNALGQLISTQRCESVEQEIDLSQYPKGLYLIQLKTNTVCASGKFIKD